MATRTPCQDVRVPRKVVFVKRDRRKKLRSNHFLVGRPIVIDRPAMKDQMSLISRPGRVQTVDSNQSQGDQIEPTSTECTRVGDDSANTTSTMVSQEEQRVSWSWEDLEAAQRADPETGPIISWLLEKPEQPPWDSVTLKSSGTKTLWRMWSRLSIRDNILKRRFEEVDGCNERWQIVLPGVYRSEFMQIAHGGMTGGHLGSAKTASGIQLRAYWPTWKSDLETFLRACEPCARYYRGKVRHQAPLQTPLIGEPWQRVSVDITGPHPRSSNSKQYILTLVDHFSKWAEAIPLGNHTAPTVAKAHMTHVFSRFGVPRQLLTDRGPEFESGLFTELMRCMDIDKLRTTPYKASTNAVAERFHRTLNSMLGKVVAENQRDWDVRLPYVVAAYRASPHSSTGFSPNRLFLGRETFMPVDLVWGIPEGETEKTQNADEFVQKVRRDTEAAYELARKQLLVAAERRKVSYDARVKKVDFNVGEWVWYYYPRRFLKRSPKWQKLYTGPYLIVRAIQPVNFVLQRSPRSKPFVVHADKLKKCLGPTPRSWLTALPGADSPGQPAVDDIQPTQETMPDVNQRPGRPRARLQALPDHLDDEGDQQESQSGDANPPRPQRAERRPPAYLRDFYR